jgi:lipid-A-disaccharide synthase
MVDTRHEKDVYALRRAFDAAMVSSGTATLETAILGTPMALLYRVHSWEYAIGRWLVNLPYIGLPNVVAGKKIIAEYIQADMTPSKVAAALWQCLDDAAFIKRQKRELRAAVAALGRPGVARRAAAAVLETARA